MVEDLEASERNTNKQLAAARAQLNECREENKKLKQQLEGFKKK